MLNIPLTVGVVGVIIGPMLALVGLSAAVLSKCKIKIANEEGDTVIDLGEFSEDKFNTIKDMVSTKAKDEHGRVRGYHRRFCGRRGLQ